LKTTLPELEKGVLGLAATYALIKGIFTGNLKLAGLGLSEKAGGRLATKLLTDPKYQNMVKVIATALKNERWNSLNVLTKKFGRELKKDKILSENQSTQQ